LVVMKERVRPSRILIFGCLAWALVWIFLVLSRERGAFTQPVQSEELALQETYVSEVIFEAPWAARNLYQYGGGEESPPGEFGHYASQEGEFGPNSFTVAPNGDVYINDPLNKRVQRFGPGGEFISVVPISGGFICVDKDNDIYTTRASRPHWLIEKYNQAGNLLASHAVEVQRSLPVAVADIYCDNSGAVLARLFYSGMPPDGAGPAFPDSTWNGICQVADGIRGFSLDEQTSSIKKEAYIGCNSVLLERNLLLMPDRGLVWGYGNLYLVNLSGDTVQVLRGLRGVPFGCDENLNVYTKEVSVDFYARQYDEEEHAPLVRKYNAEGRLVSTFRYWCGKPYVGVYKGDGFASAVGDCTFLDPAGNLYLFCQSYKDGIKVIKWHKSD
jgi:hypothetical protein